MRFARSRDDYDNPYNDNYYDRGTTFDRVGNAMNSHNLGQRRNSQYSRGYQNNVRYRGANTHSQQYDPRYVNQQYQNAGYNPQYENYQERGRRAPMNQEIPERVEQLVYDSAILQGTYHNLDDPKGDIRTFEDENKEDATNTDTTNTADDVHSPKDEVKTDA